MPSRSIAIETARRNTGFENHPYLTGSTSGVPGFFFGILRAFAVLRLNQKKLVVSAGPRE